MIIREIEAQGSCWGLDQVILDKTNDNPQDQKSDGQPLQKKRKIVQKKIDNVSKQKDNNGVRGVSLYTDLMIYIFSKLDFSSLRKVPFVSKFWWKCFNKLDWKGMCKKIDLPLQPKQDPKKAYFEAMDPFENLFDLNFHPHLHLRKPVQLSNQSCFASWATPNGIVVAEGNFLFFFNMDATFLKKVDLNLFLDNSSSDQLVPFDNRVAYLSEVKKEALCWEMPHHSGDAKLVWKLSSVDLLNKSWIIDEQGNWHLELGYLNRADGMLNILDCRNGQVKTKFELYQLFNSNSIDLHRCVFDELQWTASHIIISAIQIGNAASKKTFLIERNTHESWILPSHSQYLLTQNFLVENPNQQNRDGFGSSYSLIVNNLTSAMKEVHKVAFSIIGTTNERKVKMPRIVVRSSDPSLDEVSVLEFYDGAQLSEKKIEKFYSGTHINLMRMRTNNLEFQEIPFILNKEVTCLRQEQTRLFVWLKPSTDQGKQLYVFDTRSGKGHRLYKAENSEGDLHYLSGRVFEFINRDKKNGRTELVRTLSFNDSGEY